MRYSTILVFLAAIQAFASSASASQEQYVDWRQVRIVSSRYEETGTIVFDAHTDGDAYKAISIDVFGKQFKVEEPQLAKLKGFPLNSLSITHEVGYQELGGHTVHFAMKRVYRKSMTPLEERIRISVSKGKGLEIHGPETKELKEVPD